MQGRLNPKKDNAIWLTCQTEASSGVAELALERLLSTQQRHIEVLFAHVNPQGIQGHVQIPPSAVTMACYRTFLSIEALFRVNGEELKISPSLWQTVEGRASIFTTSSTALKLMNVTALLSSDKIPPSRFINIQETHLRGKASLHLLQR